MTRCGLLTTALVMSAGVASAQEALRSALAGEAADQEHRRQWEAEAYTFKLKDFKLLASSSLGLDWNDNVTLNGSQEQQDDFILRPGVRLGASYPITQSQVLRLNVGFGYSKYFKHDELSTWNLTSDSGLSFDTYVKSFVFNLHDRFQYTQDSAREAAVANTGTYGNFQNTAGASVTWVPNDTTWTLGYDHLNYFSTSDEFERMNRATENFLARAGWRMDPRLTVGVEGTTSLTAYEQAILNDNTSYSAGVYADWQPGSRFHVQPRAGYSIFQFDQTSSNVSAQDLDSWYAGLNVSHQITDYVSYSVAAGREIRLGIESDALEDWYVRPSVRWALLQNVTLGAGFFFEHGKQSAGTLGHAAAETYDQYGGDFNAGYSIIRNLSMSLNYRLTVRDSNESSRNYTQNQVGLLFTYTFK